ncbi:MAG TPA: sigma-54-dependent Fis family transcriptional regulator [Vicinamibacterales bacterium]|jgi:DNA-binding NtrC family response regulator
MPIEDLQHLQLSEILEFRPDHGEIRLHDQRVVILSAAAMGLLRKELVETLGVEIARRLLMRFGYADGYHDAIVLRDQYGWTDPRDGFRAGAVLHTLEGIVQARVTRLAYDAGQSAVEAEVSWERSYEAEQHLNQSGPSPTPVCWSLIGYVSGYASACFGQEVYFRELSCVGQGRPRCELIGRHAAGWPPEDLEAFRFDFQGADLGREVNRIQGLVRQQQEELARREHDVARRERDIDVLRARVDRHVAARHFIVRSPAMQEVLELAARVAPLELTVLVYGESGTGKEFIVRMIHEQSTRGGGPLVAVNCAALTETLLESELFGHTRGSFTGAMRDKMGLFEVATDGTLFLDEVGEMALSLQAKLLRAIQEHEIRRVGAERPIQVNARVVAATNRDLRAAVAAGTFREDLYFRLGAFIISIPPLRDRREEIPPMVHEFLRRSAARLEKNVRAISHDAMTALIRYRWPGNVRELEHAVERAVIMARGTAIAVRDLPPEVASGEAPAGEGASASLAIGANERELIRKALDQAGGNRRRTAEALGISPVTLWRKMKRYGLS